MLKCYDYAIVMAEFPDEITLAVNISNCPGNCGHVDENGKFILDCSEPWLLEDVGEELTEEKIDSLIAEHPGITLFGLMGGDSDHKDVIRIVNYIHEKHPGLKVGIYSGRDWLDLELANVIDVYKIGRWINPDMEHPEIWKDHVWGPLVWPVSNQLYFERIDGKLINCTYKFRKNPINNLERYIIK